MLALFIVTLLVFSLADASLTVALLTPSGSARSNILKIATSSLFLTGSVFLSSWIVLKVNCGVTDVLRRMGAEAPKSLVRTEDGGWTADRKYNTIVGIHFIIGDLNSVNADDEEDELRPRADNDCCSGVRELLLYCIRGTSTHNSSSSFRRGFSNSSLDFSSIYESSEQNTLDISSPYGGALHSPLTDYKSSSAK